MQENITKNQMNAAVVARGGSTNYSGKNKTMFIKGVDKSDKDSLESLGAIKFKLVFQ